MKRDLAIRALKMAIAFRSPPKGCIFHSDRGSQYCSHDYQKILRQHGFRVSMSGKGNCYDNAAVETFFKTIKAELIWRRSWATRRQAEMAIFEHINGFYNSRRRHSALGWKSPVDFSRPGKPTDNAFIEAFNGRFRMECLNAHWFLTLADAAEKLETWRRYYNKERPHSEIGNKAPIMLTKSEDITSLSS